MRLPILLSMAFVLAGCSKTAEIAQYRMPKESSGSQSTAEAADDAPSEAGKPTDRMVAAIVPYKDNAWTFKLTGPVETVAKYTNDFAKLVESVTFPKDANGEPRWKLPEGWTQKAGGSNMRFATITTGDEKPLDITVATVPWPSAEYDQRLLQNVNRWRGQMQLQPVSATDLTDSVRQIKFAEGEAAVVDLIGKLKAGGMTPPFAGKAAAANGNAMPPGHPDVSSTNASPNSRKPTASGEPATSPSNSKPTGIDQSQLPFTFTAPKDWQATPSPQFAVAAFAVGDGNKHVDVSVTPMLGPGGDLLMNVNRWRTMQLGVPAITADELGSYADPYKVDGKPAHLVRLMEPETADPRLAIEAALIEADGATWVFKMRGTADSVHSQQDNFQKFIDSIKFKP